MRPLNPCLRGPVKRWWWCWWERGSGRADVRVKRKLENKQRGGGNAPALEVQRHSPPPRNGLIFKKEPLRWYKKEQTSHTLSSLPGDPICPEVPVISVRPLYLCHLPFKSAAAVLPRRRPSHFILFSLRDGDGEDRRRFWRAWGAVNVIPEPFFCMFSRGRISLFKEHLLFNTSLSKKTCMDKTYFNWLLIMSLKCILSTLIICSVFRNTDHMS